MSDDNKLKLRWCSCKASARGFGQHMAWCSAVAIKDKDIKIGDISPSEYIRGIKNGNIDPSFHNAVKAILWAADEIERLREVRDAAQHVLNTFKKDEAQGYHSKDRQFAISILEKSLLPDLPK